ncbi:MAG: ABC transporter, permease protein 1 (cluster 1, maltose/g3p/polyamine/iron) [uncultured Chloroflexia bacterium]|jgi:multiple sugar transport system permease protein|uniref:ABC transporter, permease protein 1 (Cluster 1, maltose/g3p/polyamine/iron) n=1 Tax=uncultured Chloroflexia bacterium TaxID=1672391 RepID=A0A6J4NT13_9CHLR|nr:MAG: ABC transporter, permease protein 1 (cluster 1, maltose/g3p/polyamine/iron) [uncultured Chloroflexia bacterium]
MSIPQPQSSERVLSKPRRRRRATGMQRREAIEGFLWISPWIIGFVVFTLGPMLASLYLSFTRYAIGSTPEWIGAANYQEAFTVDPLFWPSMGRTIFYAVLLVFFGIILSLLAALLLNQEIRGRNVFRALFYLPSLTPVVSLAVIWGWLLQPNNGLINYLLGFIGIDGPGWLTSRSWVIPAIVMISLWSSVGGGRMIIFLAGLQGVPQQLYEAAKIDGAGQLAQFWYITLPLISPTILFNAIISITGSFSVFSLAYIATAGGPNYGSWFYMLHLYNNAFSFFQMGYASALAWILFAVILALTLFQLWLSRRWVHYEYEGAAR